MGGSSRGQGASMGANKADVMGHAERASKSKANNPGLAGTAWGRAGTAVGTRQAQDAYNNARSAVGRAASGNVGSRRDR